MPSSTTFIENLTRFALSVSGRMVLLAILVSGATLVVSTSEIVLVLALLAAYLATAVLLVSLAAPELALAVAIIGIFVTLVMNVTARQRRNMPAKATRNRVPLTLRVLVVFITFWLCWSLNLFNSPLDLKRMTIFWLVINAIASLATTTDPFKAGISVLTLQACSLLYYATSTTEVSLLVMGVVALSSFAIALATSYLSLSAQFEAEK